MMLSLLSVTIRTRWLNMAPVPSDEEDDLLIRTVLQFLSACDDVVCNDHVRTLSQARRGFCEGVHTSRTFFRKFQNL